MINRYEKYRYKIVEFQNPLELAEYLKPQQSNEGYTDVKECTSDSRFRGGKTIKDMVHDMTYGDDKATASLLYNIKSTNKEIDQDNGWVGMDIEGVAFDMGSVVGGEPECCIAMGQPSIKKHLKIIIDVGYCGETEASIIQNRGVGILNLINTLQCQGYILDVGFIRFNKASMMANITNINTENICVAQLAPLCHPTYFRGCTWLVEAMENKSHSSGSGNSTCPKEVIDSFEKDGVFYIGGGYTDSKMSSLKDGTKATEYIAKLFNKFCEEQNKYS